MTMESGIPSIWAVAKSGKAGKLNLICAAGAHLDPIRAAKSAIHELAGMAFILEEMFEADRDKIREMFHDPYRVQNMEDHVMLYGLPEAEERLLFLLDNHRPLRTFDEEFQRKVSNADLTDDLRQVIQVFHRLNYDVIVVDQSTPETLRNELYCVKVLIPGLLPMTFGHHLTRITGLERVFRLPAELGYAKEPLTPERLNPHPHPFL
jgi:ribosomal protein S12 methylthiotransferase accessory factor